jgi:hypothetical protein
MTRMRLKTIPYAKDSRRSRSPAFRRKPNRQLPIQQHGYH